MNVVFKHITKSSYWAKKLVVLLLCNLHALTRYKVARSFGDLFYSPNGLFCFHTVVVIACFAAFFWSMYDDAKIVRELMDEMIEEVKALIEELK